MTRFLRVRGPPIPSPQFPVPSFQSPCPQPPGLLSGPYLEIEIPAWPLATHTPPTPAYPSLPHSTADGHLSRLTIFDAPTYSARCSVATVRCPIPIPILLLLLRPLLACLLRLVSSRLASSRFACSQLFSSVTVFSYARLFSFPIRLVVSKSLRPHHTPLHAFSHIPSPTPFLSSSSSFPPFLLAPHPLITSGHTRRCQSPEDCFRPGLGCGFGFGWYLRYIHDSAAAARRASSSCPACFGCFDTYAYYDRIDRMPIFGWYYTPIQ